MERGVKRGSLGKSSFNILVFEQLFQYMLLHIFRNASHHGLPGFQVYRWFYILLHLEVVFPFCADHTGKQAAGACAFRAYLVDDRKGHAYRRQADGLAAISEKLHFGKIIGRLGLEGTAAGHLPFVYFK